MPDSPTPVRLPFPIDPRDDRPEVTLEAAEDLVQRIWKIDAAASPIPGERDRNFVLRERNGSRFVLKISARSETERRLDFETRLVRSARRQDPALRLPELLPTAAGEDRIRRRFGDSLHHIRLFRYLEGVPISSFRRRPPALLDSIGRFLGRLQNAIAAAETPNPEASNPAAREPGPPRPDTPNIPWALPHAERVIREAAAVLPAGPERGLYQRLADSMIGELPQLLALPSTPIHNDANDDNLLLISGEPEAAGPEDLILLDFGDALAAPAVVEAATAALYASGTAPDPIGAAALVLKGFADEHPVTGEEAALFRTAIGVRALVSAGVAALRREAAEPTPPEPYLLTSEDGVWHFLRTLEAETPAVADGRFRLASGHDPLPGAAARRTAIRRAAAEAAPPIRWSGGGVRWLDLTPASPTVDPAAPGEALARAAAAARKAGATAIGRTGEARFPETAPTEADPAPARNPSADPRTIELGIEVFAPSGTLVTAALDGAVASVGEDSAPWGSSLAVRIHHQVGTAELWTRYRHLARDGLKALRPGDPVRRGEPLGALAEPPAKSGWPPHLRFQLLAADLGNRPPGRCTPGDFPLFRALCPDPSPFLGLDDSAAAAGDCGEEVSALRKARRRHLSGVLSLSYDDPIQVVRGRGARLYDAAGRDYLDMVNNVCHVGHSHPQVAGAIARQAGLLNTNTRYLYRELTDYAERLAATLPDPLEVVFLTNSGSEANDLALRIARTRLGTRKTLVFESGYHGNLTSLIEVSPYKLDGSGGAPGPRWLHRLPMPCSFRSPFRGHYREAAPGFREALIADAERRIHDCGPAAFLGEAILGCGGQIVPPPGYLGALYRAVHDAGGVVVADEVQTGFGRVGPDFWAFLAVQDDGDPVIPDIVTLGKPAGNGHPLGAVVTTRELARSFETGMEYFNTFGGNPVSCAAGLAVLEVIRDEGLAAHAEAVGTRLLCGLDELANRYPIVGQARGRGLFLGFELVRDSASREPAPREAHRLVNRLREFRILNSTDGPDANVIKIKPPLPFSAADADRYLETLEFVLREQF